LLKVLQTYSGQIYGLDLSDDTCAKTSAENYNLEIISWDNSTVLSKIDLIIITLFPEQVSENFEQLNNKINHNTLVIEISGVKEKLYTHLIDTQFNFNYILPHSMAGSEYSGY